MGPRPIPITRSVSSGDGRGTGASRVFENGALDLRSGSDDADVGRIFDGDNGAGGQHQFGPGLAQIDYILGKIRGDAKDDFYD